MRPERHAPITLERDCEATLIPGGQRVTLSQGDEVIVTQFLGGSFTVQTGDGYLAGSAPKMPTRSASSRPATPRPTKARPRPARSISRR